MVVPTLEHKQFPLCIQLAATGDQGLWKRRRFIAQPLLAQGIGSLILENAYYGSRRPKQLQLPHGALSKVRANLVAFKLTLCR
jgi:hypothetical protein